jgi:hypothetical protein
MILSSEALYECLAPLLRPFERGRPYRELAVEQQPAPRGQPEVLVSGLGR